MLNGNILCKEIVEEVTKGGIIIPTKNKKNYKKFKVVKSDEPDIKEDFIVYTPPHGITEYEGHAIIKKAMIIMIE